MIQKKSKQKTKQQQNNLNKQILQAAYIFVGLFILLIGYFAYVCGISGKDVINNSYNKLQNHLSNSVVRGNIYSADGKLLATTKIDDEGNESRSYPYDKDYCHVIGSVDKGRYGLEAAYNFELLSSTTNVLSKFANDFMDRKDMGDSLVTTLDSKLQAASVKAFDNYKKGAVIVMDSKTGAILSMVSAPSYNPNTMSDNWEEIQNSESSMLLNRATQGLYTPGSIFKIFTLYEYLKEGKTVQYSYDCDGSTDIDDFVIHCSNHTAHGVVDLRKSFAYSCNTSFVNIGKQLNTEHFNKTMEKLLFNQSLPLKLAYNKSSFSLEESDSDFLKAQTYFGQGETLMTPIHAAMLVSAIANDGVMMQPYLVQAIQNENKVNVKTHEAKEYETLFDKKSVKFLKESMYDVIAYGTAKSLGHFENLTVYGKTGTAEIENGSKVNSWFVGFAEDDNTKDSYTVVVVAEGISANSSTSAAVNITKDILKVLD